MLKSILTFLSIFLFGITISYSQNNIFPDFGFAGINTLNPNHLFNH